MLPHSKEYYCQKNNVRNTDSTFSIKHNSMWNYNNISKIETLSEEALKEDLLNINFEENNYLKQNTLTDNIIYKNNNINDKNLCIFKNNAISDRNDNLNCNKVLKRTNTYHFETPKNKVGSKNSSLTTNISSLSLYPSSPTSPVFTALNDKKEYQVLWSPSMETPTLNRSVFQIPSYTSHSNLVSPENMEKSDMKNYKSKSLISFSTSTSNNINKQQQDSIIVSSNKKTPKNVIKFNSNLTTPDSEVKKDSNLNKNSKVSEQSLLFKTVLSDTYLSSPVISPDFIKDKKTPYFRYLFYKDNNKENEKKKSNIDENKNEKLIENNHATPENNSYAEKIKTTKFSNNSIPEEEVTDEEKFKNNKRPLNSGN